MDISGKITSFETQAINRKKLLFSFLEKFDIGNGQSINDYITDTVLLIENTEATDNYTYWMDGGLSWFYWYKENLKEVSEKELISMMICNLKFHYVFNEVLQWQKKTKRLCILVEQLKTLLGTMNIETEVEVTNFQHYTSGFPEFDFYYSQAKQKEPFYNIKLVLKTERTGGSRSPSKTKKSKIETERLKMEKTREIKEKKREDFKKLAEPFSRDQLPLLNNKIVVEFQLEYFHPFNIKNEVNIFDISQFKERYIDEFKYITKYDSFIEPVFARKFLNKLNLNGLITFSYLNNAKKESESGLNIEKLRQNYLLKKIDERDINAIFTNVKRNYIRLFEKFKCFNVFFIEKIDNLLLEYNLKQYKSFIDMIDKYFMVLFRPAINSFIVDVNKELLDRHGVKLFIAGGDAMRRFNYDISFTSDIDCKLHIKNAIGENKKYLISNLIMENIVKLRNYFEENKMTVLSDIVSTQNRGLEVFKYSYDNEEIRIDVLLDDEMKDRYQQFRTRDNKKNEAMPVDLYSLDFRYQITHYDMSNRQRPRVINKFNHLISILDVVIIDDKDFKETDLIETNGVAYASKNFLLKDFENTYNNEDMALGRISNDKSKKDIQRYNMMSLDNPDTYTPKINALLSSINDIDLSTIKNEQLVRIIQKIMNRMMINIHDFFVIRNLSYQDTRSIFKYPLLVMFFKNIKQLKINLPFEDLNRLDVSYSTYDYLRSSSDVIRKYVEIFQKISNFENDGLFKHAAPFNNKELLNEIKPVIFKEPRIKITMMT